MADTIQTHRMTNLVSTSNPVLADGELIFNEVSKDLRIGDAGTQYNSLDRLDMCGATQPYKTIITYDADEVVVYSGALYSSLQGSNTNNQPDTSPLYWEAVGAGGSGETFAMNWGYDVTTTAADPGAGIFRLNNATIASSTVMYISPEDADGIDASELIEALTANDFQYLENVADPTEGMLIKIVSVVDNTGWYTVTYTIEGQASATSWTDEGDFGVLFMFRGGSGGGHVIQDDGTGMTQRTNLNFIGFDVSDDAGNDATVVELAEASSPIVVENVSLTEIKTDRDFEESAGSWRPIYRQKMIYGTLPNTTTVAKAHGISSVSMIWAVISESHAIDAVTLPLPYPSSSSTSNISLFTDGTNVTIATGRDRTNYTGYVMLEYTKTTDTATSEPRKTVAGGLGGSATNVLYDSGVLTAATQTITIPDSVMAGRTNVEFEVIAINSGVSSTGYLVYVDNDTTLSTDYVTQYTTSYGTGVAGARLSAQEPRIGWADSGNERAKMTGWISLISGKMMFLSEELYESGGYPRLMNTGGYKKTEALSDLSGMTIVATVADGFGIGSRVRILDPTIAGGASGSETKAYGTAYRTTALNLAASNTWYDIPMDGGNKNLVNTTHSTSTNPERLYVTEDGDYEIRYAFSARRNTNDHHAVGRATKNGTEIVASFAQAAPMASDANFTMQVIAETTETLVAGDYVTAQIGVNYVSTGDELDLFVGSPLPDPTTRVYASLTLHKIS